ncbi:hypothetical protein [Streptomyces sp. NPDC048603]|uniref:hypothetical protein n=1 Tax=Streptomyces sp. NPDC048603 TaxID=3365577 RepID=UPI00371ABBC0
MRTAAVRAVLIASVTVTLSTVTFFLTLTGSWLAFPMVLCSVAGIIVSTWGVLDVWITRQAWRQRHGVVSQPSSTARGRRPATASGGGTGQRTYEAAAGPRTAYEAGAGQPRPLRRA